MIINNNYTVPHKLCDVCGIELIEPYYEFITVNDNHINVCENCLIHRSRKVEEAVASVNVN